MPPPKFRVSRRFMPPPPCPPILPKPVSEQRVEITELKDKREDPTRPPQLPLHLDICVANDVPTLDMFTSCLSLSQGSGTIRRRNETAEILEDQLKLMITQVKSNLSKGDYPTQSYSVVQGDLASEMFWWCKALRVNTPTFFRSMELFDRFHLALVEEMKPTWEGINPTEWQECLERIVNQKELRIVSSIMLASKIECDTKHSSLSLQCVKSALQSENKTYSNSAITDSEIRVFRLLNYRTCWITPFDIVEQMVALIQLPDPKDYPRFYSLSTLYLNYTYLRHSEFWAKVRNVNNTNWTPKLTSEQFQLSFEFNAVIRGALVVAASAFHIGFKVHSSVARKLASIINEPVDKVEKLSLLLMDVANVFEIKGKVV